MKLKLNERDSRLKKVAAVTGRDGTVNQLEDLIDGMVL